MAVILKDIALVKTTTWDGYYEYLTGATEFDITLRLRCSGANLGTVGEFDTAIAVSTSALSEEEREELIQYLAEVLSKRAAVHFGAVCRDW